MPTAVFVVATLLVWASQAQRDRVVAPEPSGTAVLAGRVTILDANGEPQPVRRARVTLESEGVRSRAVDTDTQGRYRFERLPAGSYRVRAEKAGFVPSLRDPRRAFERPAAFTVTTGQKMGLDIPMVRGAALEGRITTDTGDAAVNVVVSAVRLSYDANGRRTTPVRQVRTDDRGLFRIHSLPSGDYYLEAAPDPLDVLTQTPVPGRQRTTLARVFYPAAPRVEGGQSIALATGQNMTGLEFSLPTVVTVAVRGKVIDSTGAPARNMFIRLQRVGGPVGEVRGTADPEGVNFSYPSVPPGEYWLMGVARPSPTAELEFGVTRLTVGGQDLTDLSLTTSRGLAVQGRVQVEGGAPLGAVQVAPIETEYQFPALRDAPDASAPVPVARDGTFMFPSLAGPKLFRVQPMPAGWALKGVWLDDVEITDAAVDLKGNDRPRTLTVILTSQTGTVWGVVRDEKGQPAGRARIVVFNADDRMWGWRSRWVKSVESDDSGRYEVAGLLDGKYQIVAVPFLEEGSWMDASILARLQPIASAMAVTGAAKQTINLVIKP